ncbi:hypothetical protein PLANTIT3_20142 [Plantibacter sp. T3]|nr:hypothetical protein PLANTIT3_20142 [Plantibacter sp. T3]
MGAQGPEKEPRDRGCGAPVDVPQCRDDRPSVLRVYVSSRTVTVRGNATGVPPHACGNWLRARTSAPTDRAEDHHE